MNNLNNLKKEYDSIEASDILRKRVEKTMEKKTNKTAKTILSIAASFLIVSIITLNLSPTLAVAASDIPVLGPIIKVVTLGRFVKEEEGNYEADVAVPEISGLNNKELEDKLNSEFRDDAEKLFNEFNSDIEEMKKNDPDAEIHKSLIHDYEILTDNDKYLVVDVVTFTAAASSDTSHKLYTIRKSDSSIVTLAELFDSGVDYQSIISEYLLKEMGRRNDEEDAAYFIDGDEFVEGFKEIKPDQNFYIDKDNNLIISFDKYEVAAGYMGDQEFLIPESVISINA